ncbi:ArsA-related P-loop ATPase [Streptomyces sp. CAU 1734]|uniref:ArsA family ATPase n=1 Tax=Streptomyces sp. CAU 1734 TaxID=3140360 RepID=UPI003261A9B7
MRTVLVTGLGGAGRTTVAAATAIAAAARGSRVLLLARDTAPDGLLGTALAATPVEITPGLWAARTDSGAVFRAEFLALQERAGSMLDLLGATRLAGEELTELPGSAEFALLRALATAVDGGWDLVVADLPPVREALALLALPGELRRYLRRLLPPERQAARALRPVLAQLAGVPMPVQELYETAARRDTELAAVQALLAAPGTAVRLVAEPGPSAAGELRTARTGLALHGMRTEALVANRILPRHSADPWLAGLAAQQEKTLQEWHGEWAPGTAVIELPHTGQDPRGTAALALLAAPGRTLAPEPLPAPPAPGPDPAVIGRVEDRRTDDGTLVWSIPLPGARKGDIGLVRRGDELLLRVGPFRRIVPLPSALRRCAVSGAALTGDVLAVRFTPDPGLWPSGG